jgi:HK97 family phage portal protein
MPLELWPVRPDKIAPVPDTDDFLKGYTYTGPNGEKIPLGLDEVISIYMPNPLDPYTGLGPVQALLTDLDSVKYAAVFNKKFFENDASPGGVVEVDTRLSDSEWEEFQQRWRAGHQGVSNAHRVAMLENGAKWKDVQFTMRDMQFSELRNISREIIREAFRIHPHMLGLTEDINRANAEAAEDVFARWVLKPRLDRIKDALNEQFLPLFGSSGEGLEFDFDDPSLEDSEATNATLTAKATAAKTLVDAGGDFVSVLEALGLPAIEAKPEPEPQPVVAPVPPGTNGQSKPVPVKETVPA